MRSWRGLQPTVKLQMYPKWIEKTIAIRICQRHIRFRNMTVRSVKTAMFSSATAEESDSTAFILRKMPESSFISMEIPMWIITAAAFR